MRKTYNPRLVAAKLSAAAILLMLLAPACAVFRSGNKSESDSLSLKNEVYETETVLNAKEYREVELFYADSGKSTLEVKIIPEGEFEYSPEAGFKGKAKSVFITDTQQAWKQGVNRTAEMYEQKFDSAVIKKTESHDQLRIKEKSSLVKKTGEWKLGILLGILVIGLVLWKKVHRIIF